jgi:hypothetical protein
MQIQVCTNHGPQGSGGATIGKSFLHVFILEKISRTSRPISIKLDTNHPCIKEIQICINRRSGSLQRGDNCKNRVGSFKKKNQEPLSQKSSDLRKSFLIKCKLKFVNILVLGDLMGPWLGKTFLHKLILEKPAGQLQSNLMQIILVWREFKVV